MRILDPSNLEWDRESTASLPSKDCVTRRPRPRSSSADAVARYHRYYHLLRKNLGPKFTWNTYAALLHDAIRDYRTPNLHSNVPKKRVIDVATQTAEVQFSPAVAYHSTPKRNSWSLEQEEERPQHLSMRRRCRDMLVRTRSTNHIGSPNPSLTPKKLSGDNMGLVRDISSRIERIATLTRKKSSKRMKQLTRTFTRTGYMPVSSGYSSSDRGVLEATSSGSGTPLLTPVSGTSRAKDPKTRKKIKMEVVEYY